MIEETWNLTIVNLLQLIKSMMFSIMIEIIWLKFFKLLKIIILIWLLAQPQWTEVSWIFIKKMLDNMLQIIKAQKANIKKRLLYKVWAIILFKYQEEKLKCINISLKKYLNSFTPKLKEQNHKFLFSSILLIKFNNLFNIMTR